MRGTILALTVLTALSSVPSWASTVIVKEGETLSEIASRNKVSVQSLIELNSIRDSDYLAAGQRLRLPNNQTKELHSDSNHKVVNGDTISNIALRYRINEDQLIRINNLNNANYLYEGQLLVLPSKEDTPTSSKNKFHTVVAGDTLSKISLTYKINEQELIKINQLKNADSLYIGQNIKLINGVKEGIKTKNNNFERHSSDGSFHMISKGDTLSSIAKTYQVPIAKLIEINSISSPDMLTIGKKLKLISNQDNNKKDISLVRKKEVIKPDWRTYGPLKVDWANWKSLDGSYVTPGINKEGKALYLAINCKASKLNATGANGTWKSWISPMDSFEHNLLNDLCNKKKPKNS